MKKVVLILAGGAGRRMWPIGSEKRSKQFIALSEKENSLFQQAVKRALLTADLRDIFVSTNEGYRAVVRKQWPEGPEENIICEPVRRNTAPAILLAMSVIRRHCGDCVVTVCPSDHLIPGDELYERTMRDAFSAAIQTEKLVTIGVAPTFPSTEFGYIKAGEQLADCPGTVWKVKRFCEKPDAGTAQKLIQEGCLWNTGIFIWKTSVFFSEAEQWCPGLNAAVAQAAGSGDMRTLYERLPAISIDYALMEKTGNAAVIPAAFSWRDVGSVASFVTEEKTV